MRRSWWYIIILVALIASWEIAGSVNKNIYIFISTPSMTMIYFVKNFIPLLRSTGITLFEALIGLLLAGFFSFTSIIISLYSKKFLEFILPIMIVSQVIPIICLAPLIILLFGVGVKAKIIISALMCFFPIFINFYNGIERIDSNILNLCSIYNASTLFKIKNIFFPLSLPSIIAGFKISSTLSVIGAIVGEFNGADIGLGKNLFLAAKRIEPELMNTSLLLSSLIGLGLFGLIILIERKLGKWYLK